MRWPKSEGTGKVTRISREVSEIQKFRIEKYYIGVASRQSSTYNCKKFGPAE